MGCWNETCALTRTAIAEGMPIVVLNAVPGIGFRGDNRFSHAIFGMPTIGEYDDYGGVCNVQNPNQAEFEEKAFAKSGFYREVKSGNDTVWLASSYSTFWGMTHQLKQLYYTDYGISPAAIHSHSPDDSEKMTAAYLTAEKDLQNFCAQLKEASFDEEDKSLWDIVFQLVKQVFGDAKAWSVYQMLSDNGLIAQQQPIIMHKVAYDTLVQKFGERKLHYYHETEEFTIREYIENTLKNTIERFNSQYQESLQMWKGISYKGTAEELHEDIMLFVREDTGFQIAPTAQPWRAPRFPLIGHYWGGATFEEIMEVIPHEQIIDFLVFQWAIQNTRIELRLAETGSQSREGEIILQMMDAIRPVLAERQLDGQDYNSCLFRR